MRKIAQILIVMMSLTSVLQTSALSDADQQIEAALLAEAQRTDHPWESFLLSQPVEVFVLEDGRTVYSVAAWNPNAEQLEGEEETWLAQIRKNVSESRVSMVTDDSVDDADIGAFVKEIKKAAVYAEKQFDLPEVRIALATHVLPERLFDESGKATPIFSALKKAYDGKQDPTALAAALSMQTGATLNVKEGPTALKLAFYVLNDEKAEDEALEAAFEELSAQDKANALSREEIATVLARAFERRMDAAFASGNKGEKRSIIVDISKVMDGQTASESFSQYASEITQSFMRKVPELEMRVRELPDYPLRDQPTSGVISSRQGDQEGTLLILQSQDDGMGRYVALTDENANIALTAFIRSGETCRAYVPQGNYTILCAKGIDWYGYEALFDVQGIYTASVEPVAVLDDTHYHRITFGGDESIPVRDANPEEFTGRIPDDASKELEKLLSAP